ncbi:O-antigen assembly polymerase [Pasteurellaceae bacterium HPA106]|uniref:ECA oligosaccharide polymerase n=1 Tax=Spirabiliibacterium pneumoniae TaxID=221400 RepID=UPI001AAD3364|nr:ECA oligosaccharide polymerase [Spirabiliibacterium pneumoniae]MBE2896811.1 O-antigen assembly polymerase [Spirabiliibacterium pneumoniae]
MLNLGSLFALLALYLISVSTIGFLTYRHYLKVRFNFYLLFSVIYLITFFLGLPFSLALAYNFDFQLLEIDILLAAQFAALAFYLMFYVAYSVRLTPYKTALLAPNVPSAPSARDESASIALITGILLLLVGLGTVALFFAQNGFLLFKLSKYSQIFSQQVSGVALKRFFYFCLPALLVFYFLTPSKKQWFFFLLFGVSFGILTYILVGGTRANMALAVALFFFIGISQRYLSISSLLLAGVIAIGAMFALALARYGLNVQGAEAVYTFLYLTRDTFSPWENFATILSHHNHIEWQGLAPIARDFYVFIPKTWWEARPDLIVNSANYFTWEILHYHAGLAISPTLLGSLYIMGGVPFLCLGALLCGWLVKGLDALYRAGKNSPNRSRRAILQAYCFGNCFNLIVLVREGLDAFVSRFLFYSLVFFIAVVIGALITALLRNLHCTREKVVMTRG